MRIPFTLSFFYKSKAGLRLINMGLCYNSLRRLRFVFD